MFGYGAFAELPFATIESTITPITEAVIGGHFGFDEKGRKKKWDEELSLEAQRKEKLKEALFGLPPKAREEITSAPIQTIDVASQTVIDYDALMLKIKEIDRKVKFQREENDIARILELI